MKDISIAELNSYIKNRMRQLNLEKEKINYLNIDEERKKLTKKKLSGRIFELALLERDISSIKEKSIYYKSKVSFLTKMKAFSQELRRRGK